MAAVRMCRLANGEERRLSTLTIHGQTFSGSLFMEPYQPSANSGQAWSIDLKLYVGDRIHRCSDGRSQAKYLDGS